MSTVDLFVEWDQLLIRVYTNFSSRWSHYKRREGFFYGFSGILGIFRGNVTFLWIRELFWENNGFKEFKLFSFSNYIELKTFHFF